MLAQFFSNEKIIANNKQYFNITNKEKMIYDLKSYEKNIVKEASENIKKHFINLVNNHF